MQVINTLMEKSFAYSDEKENLGVRRDEIGELMDVVAYCQDESVKEPLLHQEALWETFVQEGVTFADWLYGNEGEGSDEDRRRLQEALSKKAMLPMAEEQHVPEAKEKRQSVLHWAAFEIVCLMRRSMSGNGGAFLVPFEM